METIRREILITITRTYLRYKIDENDNKNHDSKYENIVEEEGITQEDRKEREETKT